MAYEVQRDFAATVQGLTEAAQWAEDTAQERVPDSVRASIRVRVRTKRQPDPSQQYLMVALQWHERE
jgi:hypothetical protein